MDSLPEPGAIVILASRLLDGDPQQSNIDNVTKRFHDMISSDGVYPSDQIMYLIDKTQQPYRGLNTLIPPSKEALRQAITEWAIDYVGDDRPFTLYIANHGEPDRLYIDKPNNEWITPKRTG